MIYILFIYIIEICNIYTISQNCDVSISKERNLLLYITLRKIKFYIIYIYIYLLNLIFTFGSAQVEYTRLSYNLRICTRLYYISNLCQSIKFSTETKNSHFFL